MLINVKPKVWIETEQIVKVTFYNPPGEASLECSIVLSTGDDVSFACNDLPEEKILEVLKGSRPVEGSIHELSYMPLENTGHLHSVSLDSNRVEGIYIKERKS